MFIKVGLRSQQLQVSYKMVFLCVDDIVCIYLYRLLFFCAYVDRFTKANL